jgi:hypothetical protein
VVAAAAVVVAVAVWWHQVVLPLRLLSPCRVSGCRTLEQKLVAALVL